MSTPKMIHQNAFTIMVNVKEGKEKELRNYLRENDLPHDRIFDFQLLSSTHFCRMFVIDNLKNLDNKVEGPSQFVFTSNFDGNVRDQIKLLVATNPEVLDEIFSFCEDYPVNNRTNDDRQAFLHQKNIGVNLFWAADVGGTVPIIREEEKLYAKVQEILNINRDQWENLSLQAIKQNIEKALQDSGFSWALTPRPKRSFIDILNRIFTFIRKLLTTLVVGIGVVLPLLPLILIIARIIEKKAQKKIKEHPIPKRSREEIEKLLESEDNTFQNQLTIYGTLDRPYWFRKTILQIALYLFRFNGAYRATKGALSGITTIHFARWVLFNNNNNIMFCSNYDGGWQSYLTEFVDNASPAMNLTFGQTYGYPDVKWLLGGGAHDEQNFKNIVRQNQYICEVFYSAYPDLTIKNIMNNKAIRSGLSKSMNDAKVKKWLHRL